MKSMERQLFHSLQYFLRSFSGCKPGGRTDDASDVCGRIQHLSRFLAVHLAVWSESSVHDDDVDRLQYSEEAVTKIQIIGLVLFVLPPLLRTLTSYYKIRKDVISSLLSLFVLCDDPHRRIVCGRSSS